MVDEKMEATKDIPAFLVASNDIYNEMKSKGCPMDQYLAGKEIDKDIYSSFINKHLASTRAAYIKKCIELGVQLFEDATDNEHV